MSKEYESEQVKKFIENKKEFELFDKFIKLNSEYLNAIIRIFNKLFDCDKKDIYWFSRFIFHLNEKLIKKNIIKSNIKKTKPRTNLFNKKSNV